MRPHFKSPGKTYNEWQNTTGADVPVWAVVNTNFPPFPFGVVVGKVAENSGEVGIAVTYSTQNAPNNKVISDQGYGAIRISGVWEFDKKNNADPAAWGGDGTVDLATGEFDPAGTRIGTIVKDSGVRVEILLNDHPADGSTR